MATKIIEWGAARRMRARPARRPGDHRGGWQQRLAQPRLSAI